MPHTENKKTKRFHFFAQRFLYGSVTFWRSCCIFSYLFPLHLETCYTDAACHHHVCQHVTTEGVRERISCLADKKLENWFDSILLHYGLSLLWTIQATKIRCGCAINNSKNNRPNHLLNHNLSLLWSILHQTLTTDKSLTEKYS